MMWYPKPAGQGCPSECCRAMVDLRTFWTGHLLHAQAFVRTCAIVDVVDGRLKLANFPFLYQALTAALPGTCRKPEKHGHCFRCSVLWDENMVV